jgi:hypothetical protein
MTLNQRERILALGVLLIAGGYAAFLLVQKTYLGPLAAQRTQLRTLQSDLANKNRLIEQGDEARGLVAELEAISLPGDARTAQSLYQEFLFKLVQDCQLEEASVEPLRTVPGGFFTRVPFTVSGKITLKNLTELLYRFYEPKLLHQVRELEIHRLKGDSKLQVTLSVEGLALDAAARRDHLLPAGGESGGRLLAGAPLSDFALVAQKNIFEPYREPRKAPEPRPTAPEIDAARFVYFVGVPTIAETPEAWLYDRLNDAQTTLRPGDDFDLAGVKGKLIAANGTRIALDVGGKHWTLELGRNLREMQPAGGPDLVASDGADTTAGQSPRSHGEPADEPTDETATDDRPPEEAVESEESEETTQLSQTKTR